MLIEKSAEIERIRKKLDSFFSLDTYSDFLFLTFDEFELKYGHYGFSFNSHLTIRFCEDPAILTEVCSLLPEAEYYVIPIFKEIKSVYKIPKSGVEAFLAQKNASDFIILELKMTWVIVYDRYRNLSGIGNYIKKKMRQNINLKFGNAKIMFTISDEQK